MPRGRPRGSGNRMANAGAYSANGLSEAMRGLTSAREALLNQRNQIDQQVSEIERMISQMGGAAGQVRRGPGRPPGSGNRGPGRPPGSGASGGSASGYRSGSLKDVLHHILASEGGPMSVKDITDRVRQAGYDTRNKTLAKSVGIALTGMEGVRKVSRGTYRLG